MTWEADKRYGRQGGRLTPGLPNPAQQHADYIRPPTTPDELDAHLLVHHHIPIAELIAATPNELAIWHRGEHSTREPGYTADDQPKKLRHAGDLRHHHRPPDRP